MSRNGSGSAAVHLSNYRMNESFVPLYAAWHSPALSASAGRISSFFANLSSELKNANAFSDDGSDSSMPNAFHPSAWLQLRADNGSFVTVTDAPVQPWSTLAPAGFHGLHCEKGSLTNWFGVLIQFVLGIVAFSSLVCKYSMQNVLYTARNFTYSSCTAINVFHVLVKRYFEPTFERRPWIIWVFDTSKQVIGTIFTHFFNLAISSIPSGTYSDPCFWYMFNYGLDCTVGLFTMWTGLSLLDVLMKWLGYTDYRLGDYGKFVIMHAFQIELDVALFIHLILLLTSRMFL